MKFIYDDGGRSTAGFKGATNTAKPLYRKENPMDHFGRCMRNALLISLPIDALIVWALYLYYH